jgi:hypothetical protein
MPAGWRSGELSEWADPSRAVRRRRRILQLVIVSLIVGCTLAALVWNASTHYARGTYALKIHSYDWAVEEFSAARILIFPYRDAQTLEEQARRAEQAAAAAQKKEDARRYEVVSHLTKARARLQVGDAAGVLTALQAIPAVNLQATLGGNSAARDAADELIDNLAVASRTALANRDWGDAQRFAAAILVLEPTSDAGATLNSRAQTGLNLSAKLGKAKDAARRGQWREAKRLGLAVLAVNKDFPGAATVVAQAKKALAPKPKAKSPSPQPTTAAAASSASSSTQSSSSSSSSSSSQPPPP